MNRRRSTPGGGEPDVQYVKKGRDLVTESVATRGLSAEEPLTVTVTPRSPLSHRSDEIDFASVIDSLQRFSTILALSDSENRFLWVNAAATIFLGRSEEELLGHSLLEFLVSPSREEALASFAVKGADDGPYGEHEFEFMRPDKTLVWGQVRTIRLKGKDGKTSSRLSVVEDITDRHLGTARESVLAADLRGYQALFERGSLGQLIVDFDSQRIEGANAAFCAMCGYSAAELEGSHVDMVLPVDDNPATDMQDRLADGSSDGRSVERILRRSDGTTLPVLATLSVVRGDDGRPSRMLALMQDLTPQRIAEETERIVEAKRLQTAEVTLFMAQHDPLTGLLDRSALIERLSELAASGHGARALMLVDIDDFNAVNDGLGHAVGDAVLLEVASRLTEAFPQLLVARYGGDQFAVAAPFVVDLALANATAATVRALLDPAIEVSGETVRVTASLGIAMQDVRESSSILIRNADSALAHAKDAGPGQYRVYDDEMRRRSRDRLQIRDGLRVALAAQQFSLAYQPIVRLSDRRILGAEALLRWTHPERGPISPVDFIPVAEQSGLIMPIGDWVMNTACADVLSLHGDLDLYVSVNASTRQLIDGRFGDWVAEVLERTGLAPGALTVEVTEGALVQELDVIRIAFDKLRSRGVRVAIDDFGTGYSSLSRLQSLPVDVIKLDRAFVTDVDTRSEGRGMAAAILQLGVAIGAIVVAEGVETEAEARTLVDLGYTMGQGYLFARPMPLAALQSRLTDLRPAA
jgi:diguanylate cyclase (GGDEF)-like protein/PAS domain S-box-containing protein